MATFIITTQTHTDTTTHTITITDTDTDTDTNTMSGISYQTEHGAVLKKAEPEALFYSKKAAKKAKNAARKPATKTVFSQADVLGLGGAEAQTGKLPALTTEAAAKALSTLPRYAVRVGCTKVRVRSCQGQGHGQEGPGPVHVRAGHAIQLPRLVDAQSGSVQHSRGGA